MEPISSAKAPKSTARIRTTETTRVGKGALAWLSWLKAGKRPETSVFSKSFSRQRTASANLDRTRRISSARIESEVCGKVEWGGVVHRNTDHPHAHIIVRGRLRSGEALNLPRELIRTRLREAAQSSLTRQLGPRTIEEIEHQKQIELTANRVTPLDRSLAGRSIPAAGEDPAYKEAGERRKRLQR